MLETEIRPSRWYYALAVLVFVGGFVALGLFLWKNLSGVTEGLQQVVVPGKVDLALAKPGKYTVFYEHESVVGNKIYSTGESVSGLECSLISARTGAAVRLSRSTVHSTYSMDGRSGTSFLDFSIDEPGTYELSAQYEEGREGPEVVLAVGQGFALKIVTAVFGGLAIVFGSMGVAVAIALVTLIKRSRARKEIESRYGRHPSPGPYPS